MIGAANTTHSDAPVTEPTLSPEPPVAGTRRSSAGVSRAGLMWSTLCLLGGLVLAMQPTEAELPDDPLAGELLFESKSCVQCHGISGESAKIGPSLETGRFGGTFLELGAALWNHAPVMSASIRRTGMAWPQLSPREATELIAFLYFIDYLGRPGSADKGRELFRSGGCSSCHVIGGGPAHVGPDLEELTAYASPLFVARQIWNHGPSMLSSLQARNLRPPRFQEGDLADLSAFIRQEAGPGPREPLLATPGNPNLGRGVFVSKQCSKCHGRQAHGGPGGPDLTKFELQRSAEAIAADMWNHALTMNAAMHERGISWPTFQNSELADLVAFLYFLPFLDPPGDATRGAEVFEKRACASCHDSNPSEETGAASPELKEFAGSPAALVAAMWNHAPLMRQAILAQGKPWPELSGSELRDLRAYLASRR